MKKSIDESTVVGLDYSQSKLYVASDGTDGRNLSGNRTNSSSTWSRDSALRIYPRNRFWMDKQRNAWHKENAERISTLYPIVVVEDLDFERMKQNRPLLAAAIENNRPLDFYNLLRKKMQACYNFGPLLCKFADM